MKCSKCETINEENATKCIKCGYDFNSKAAKKETIINKKVIASQSSRQSDNDTVNDYKLSEYLQMMREVMIKPYTVMKETVNKFNNFKYSALLAVTVAVISSILALLRAMMTVVPEKSINWDTGNKTTIWDWGNLGQINYFEIIARNFFIYLGAAFVFAGVYYLSSLVIKKEMNFSRLVGLAAISLVPFVLASLLVSPFLSMIYLMLGRAVTIIGFIYSTIILYENINNEISLSKNEKYYFNLTNLSIIGIIIYILYTKFIMNSLVNDLTNLLN